MTLEQIEIAPPPSTRASPIRVLLVEDNPGDVRLVEEGFDSGEIPVRMLVARDGQQALGYLRGEEDAPEARPDLVLLDLNLPRLSGHELLETMKSDPELREIPVVVLTTSEDEEDLHRSYRLQAAGFITKPLDAEAFITTIEDLGLYWSAVVQLPRSTRRAPGEDGENG